MKLFSKYNRVNVPVIIGSVLLISIIYYFILHFVLLHQLDSDLKIEEQEIIDIVHKKQTLPPASTYSDQQISFRPEATLPPKREISTQKIYNPQEKENELFRQLTFPLQVNNKYYVATVRKSQQQTEDLIQLIGIITLTVIAFLIAVLFVINRFILAKIWSPFNDTLRQLKQFNISSKNKLQLNPTDITEFEELNTTALLMTEKMSNDYDSLKNFTENASHEIQTPLAIIKMKLELLMQNENMNHAAMENISAISDATDRLSRLNHSLLLLTKLENNQFIENENVNITTIVENHISNIEELAAAKNLTIRQNLKENVTLFVNRSLSEILISNLIANTIKHNYEFGKIEIILTDRLLTISNTGYEPAIGSNELFERFKKASHASDSLGLGLAIVKKICDTYGFAITYTFSGDTHCIKIDFSTAL